MGRRKLSHRLGPLLARALGPTTVRLLAATWRVRYEPEDMRKRVYAPAPVIFAFWHGRLLMPTGVFRDVGAHVMISRHADGETIARVAGSLGNPAVRGSTTRGGATALLEMVEILRRGGKGVFTPDGPKGPREVAQPGAVFAASRAGVPLVPIGAAARSAWNLKSWDRFCIPRFFTRVAVVYGEPLSPPPDIEGPALDAFVARFQEAMNVANARAEALAGNP